MFYSFLHNGTDITIVLNEKGINKQFTVFSRVHNAHRIETLIGEMQAIMRESH